MDERRAQEIALQVYRKIDIGDCYPECTGPADGCKRRKPGEDGCQFDLDCIASAIGEAVQQEGLDHE